MPGPGVHRLTSPIPEKNVSVVPMTEGQVCDEMIRRRVGETHAISGRRIWAPALAVTAVAMFGAVAWPHEGANATAIRPAAWVTTIAGDRGPIVVRTGNGKCNKNTSVSINSPTIQRGVQQVSNTGESNNTQSALCRKRGRGCKIFQRIKAFHRR